MGGIEIHLCLGNVNGYSKGISMMPDAADIVSKKGIEEDPKCGERRL
jgi:hypothetical protein